MISVFFNCSSPYVGFRLLQADYVNNKMVACTEKEMTPTGYKLFNSSGSYMLLGTFHDRKYFHSCESQSVNFDEQGRPIHNSIAFLAGTSADARIINAIAAYVFFNEEEFYAEIAKYITLLDDGYTVDFQALETFLKKFEQGCQIRAKTPAADRFFREIQNSSGSYEVDFIVRQSTWNYFAKQAGRDFTRNEKYNMSDTQGEELAGQGTVYFRSQAEAKKPEQIIKKTIDVPNEVEIRNTNIPTDRIVDQPTIQKQEPIEHPKDTTTNEEHKQQLMVLQTECNAKTQLLAVAEKKAAELLAEVSRLKNTIKNSFWLGLAAGIIGTALAVLIINKLKG